jgi:lipoprotein NlpI
MKMNKLKVIALAISVIITGCASSSSLEKRANMHYKTGSYYESIGQPTVAREEYKAAREYRYAASDIFSIIIDLFNHFNKRS